jgi:hypothetical protein
MRAVLGAMPLAGFAAFWLVSFTSHVSYAQQGCVTGFSPATLSIPAAGAPQGNPVTFNVLTSSSGCQWTFGGMFFPNMMPVPPPLPWISYPSPSSGIGPATVSLTLVQPNNESTPRNFILMFGGQPLAVSQAPNPCPLTLSPVTPATIPANGGTGSFTVSTTGSPCSYNVLPSAGVTVTSGASGNTFPATVNFSVVPNTTQQPVGRAIYVSSLGTFFFSPGVSILQNGSPVATDAPFNGHVFAIHRPSSGAPHVSPPESLRITNSENSAATWAASASEPWLVLSPGSGTSPSTAIISIDPAAAGVLSRGTYEATLNITSSVAPSTPMAIRVQLRITDATSTTTAPLGVLDIPRHGSVGLNGAVPVSGWAVDDVGIARVLIYRNSVAGEPLGEVFLGEGTRVRGARSDITGAFTPGVMSAGWGLMVLSNVLPNGGNGTFVLSAYAEDIEGGRTRLGQTTVTFDNTSSPYPFGTIDIPGQGATVSGMLNNQGWVLAQPGRSIPFDGSTIRLFIDGVERPNLAGYGFARPDVAALFPFPTYPNANGPAAQFTLDTTQFADGMRTIVWVVRDDQNVVQGIGSRYIHVNNGAASQVTAPLAAEARSAATVQMIPQSAALLWERHGLDEGSWSLRFAGGATHEIRQARGERVEVALDTWWWSEGCGPYAAYLMTGDVAGPLPPGASLDGEEGLFRWLPPIEFSGAYEFAFVRKSCLGREERIPLRVILEPR